jgi:hypothetical protein
MKKILVLILLINLCTCPAFAFLYEVKVLQAPAIKLLKDNELEETYIDAKIEEEASRAFHGKAGFNPKEYEQFKQLLAYIVRLRQEMKTRAMEAPPIDEWLR